MLSRNTFLFCIVLINACTNIEQKHTEKVVVNEKHRPGFHFTPKEKWMNDPNGLVYYNNIYHLFYQYYPDSTVWGPMHWGHATSSNMIQWEHQRVALYPDSLGYIFSGSAVVDSHNTSGFGTAGKIPLVAIFTHHDPKGEKTSITYQYQGLAYSLDEGKSWTKYAQNPLLKNPGIKDFRDPKVSWHALTNKWILTLATLDRITFYSSSNLKDWTKESEFGKEFGAHGGVWECPDLFPLNNNGKQIWVLLVSINPGGPNGGSATQYFTGDFDGHKFIPYHTDTRWIDHGPDDYAGVTWSNTGDRRIFLGWMSNWQYGMLVPTEKWRSAMTVPRELSLIKQDEKYFLASTPVKELSVLEDSAMHWNQQVIGETDLTKNIKGFASLGKLVLASDSIRSFTIVLSNETGQKIELGYDKNSNQYFIDRSASGNIDFEKGFGARHTAPRISNKTSMDLTLIIDKASVELFADNGLTVMTSIFFPDTVYSKISIRSNDNFAFRSIEFRKMKAAN